MANKMPGLHKRKGIWHIDKQIFGKRLCESTGTASQREAERYLAKRVEEIRQAKIYGVRRSHTFDEAAAKYVETSQGKVSLDRELLELKHLHQHLAHLSLDAIHMDSLQPYILARQADGVKCRTINYGLNIATRILRRAASEWIDENGQIWLDRVPVIRRLPEIDRRLAYPITWEEQDRLFAKLSPLLQSMALFKVNTGCREREVCQLRWEWEIPIPELNTSVFRLPSHHKNADGELIRITKNGRARLIILNDLAKEVIEAHRGIHDEFVFAHCYRGQWKPMDRINNKGWRTARKSVELSQVRVHDLRHTFGRRLRAAGVSLEDRQDLLGHSAGRVTTEYSAAEIEQLLNAVNKLCSRQASTPTLKGLSNLHVSPAKVPQAVGDVVVGCN